MWHVGMSKAEAKKKERKAKQLAGGENTENEEMKYERKMKERKGSERQPCKFCEDMSSKAENLSENGKREENDLASLAMKIWPA